MAEIHVWQKIKKDARRWMHKARVHFNPNPTEEQRAKMLTKTLAKIAEETKKRPNMRGGTDTGWSDESTRTFGRTPLPGALGRGDSVLGLDYENPNAMDVSTLDLKLGGKK